MHPPWKALDDALAGEVALPDSAAYEQADLPFNARFHSVRPEAIVLCARAEDVAETLSFVTRHGLEHAARSGGHSFAGHSTTRGVVIAVAPMDGVAVDGGVAAIGAGARLGPVYDALQDHGLALPAGTCPPVGIAGLTLGGGLGILGRSHGITADLLLGAQVVLADGRIVECDDHHGEDLFWALRGAGSGNFGVVTSLVFRTVPAPEVANFHLRWPFSDAADLIEAWQAWAPRGPDELAASLKVTTSDDAEQPPSVDLYGALQGTESDALELIGDLVARAGADPISASCRHMSFPETRRFWADLGAADSDDVASPHPSAEEPSYVACKSEFFRRPLSTDAIAALVAHFSQDRVAAEARELDFMPWGGAYNRVRPDATAFVHREELFQLKHSAVLGPQPSPEARQAAHGWVTASWTAVHPWGSGRVFQNFADPDLADWADAYYGLNYASLVQVKARYDPANVFRSPQSLPVR